MKATSVSPAIINIKTPTQDSLSSKRKSELLRILEKYKPAQLIRTSQDDHNS